MSNETQKKSVFITGAGSGIGAATARVFSRQGWFVGLYDLNEASVRELAEELGPDTAHGPVDVTDRESVETAIKGFVAQVGGRLDVLCNNAGIFIDKEFGETDAGFLEKLVRVNVDGVQSCAHTAYPFLRETPGARLINIGSAASISGVPNEATYSATKFFVRGLTEALALEWAKYDIKVSVVMPSYVKTPMTDTPGISWIEKFGMKLSAEEVAETIFRATQEYKLHWILPREARLQSFLIRAMPLRWQLGFARWLFYGSAGK